MTQPSTTPSELSIRQFGAQGDGRTKDTTAIQAAIDSCTDNGGGTVIVPPGTYLTAPVCLRNGVTLSLCENAILLGSTDIDDYTATGRGEGRLCLISADDAHNIGLTGKGIIDGQGKAFPFGAEGINAEYIDSAAHRSESYPRPRLLHFTNCRNLSISGLTLQNSAMWCSSFERCDTVRINSITVDNRANQNTDGLDFTESKSVFISDCLLSCGDDAITMFDSADGFVITNCIISSRWSAVRVGPMSKGRLANIVVSNCVIRNTYGSALKLQRVEGGVMENISFDNIVMDNVTGPISLRLAGWLGWRQDRKESLPTGVLRNIRFSNIRARVAENALPLDHEVPAFPGELRSCMNITGLPGHLVENISFNNIHVTFPGGGTAEEAAQRDIAEMKDHYPEYHMFGTLPSYGLYAHHVQGLSLNNVRFDCSKPDMRPAIVCDDAEQVELSGFSAQGCIGQESLIRLCQTKGAFIHGSRALGDVAAFVRLEGNGSRDILLKNNDLRAAKSRLKVL